MATKITLSDAQKLHVANATGLNVHELEIPTRVLLALTDEQQAKILQATGQSVKSLDFTEFELKKIAAAMPYEAGGILAVAPR